MSNPTEASLLVVDCIVKAGSATRLAEIIGVSTSTISRWKNGQCLTGAAVAKLSTFKKSDAPLPPPQQSRVSRNIDISSFMNMFRTFCSYSKLAFILASANIIVTGILIAIIAGR